MKVSYSWHLIYTIILDQRKNINTFEEYGNLWRLFVVYFVDTFSPLSWCCTSLGWLDWGSSIFPLAKVCDSHALEIWWIIWGFCFSSHMWKQQPSSLYISVCFSSVVWIKCQKDCVKHIVWTYFCAYLCARERVCLRVHMCSLYVDKRLFTRWPQGKFLKHISVLNFFL